MDTFKLNECVTDIITNQRLWILAYDGSDDTYLVMTEDRDTFWAEGNTLKSIKKETSNEVRDR